MRLTTVCLLSTLAFLAQALLPREVVMQSVQHKDLRTLTVTVTDKNHAPINKLEAASFSVTVDKVAQEVVEASQTDSPLSVVIVFDFSGSMGARQRRASKRTRQALDAIKSFIEVSHPANEYFVVGFNDRAFTLSNAFQSAGATMGQLNAMSSGEFEGSTALYDAVHLAINTLGLGANTKRVILLVSDGQDNNSRATFKDTVNLLRKTDTLVYPVSIGSDELAGSALSEEGRSILEDFASISGGRYLEPRVGNQELSTLLSQVAAELRSQYIVRIRQAATPKNKCREFKVKVTVTEGSERKSHNSRVRKVVCDA